MSSSWWYGAGGTSMAHDVAVESRAAERYLLGELGTYDRDAYEEHFFCCFYCAAEVLSASRLIEGIRLLDYMPQPAEPRKVEPMERSSRLAWLWPRLVVPPVFEGSLRMSLVGAG